MLNTEGSLVLLLRLVRIPGWEPLSSGPPHLEALLSSLCPLFILLPLPAKICTHCLTFTQSSLITRPSPTSYIPQSRTNTRDRKEITLNFRIRPSCPQVPVLHDLPGLPKPKCISSTPHPLPHHHHTPPSSFVILFGSF